MGLGGYDKVRTRMPSFLAASAWRSTRPASALAPYGVPVPAGVFFTSTYSPSRYA